MENINDKTTFYEELCSRNEGLLSHEDQQKINNTTLLIAGCGVGSQVAVAATRLGFNKFIIVDGDTVELSNTNRQAFGEKDVDRYKVDALSDKIKEINPFAEIQAFREFVTAENAEKFVKEADVVLDIIDPEGMDAVIALHRIARSQNKIVIQPNDLGWGASVHVYSPTATTFEEIIGIDPQTPLDQINIEQATANFYGLGASVMPQYAQEVLADLMNGKIAHYPQPILAALLLSSMTLSAVLRVVLGLPIKYAPEHLSYDPFEELSPNK